MSFPSDDLQAILREQAELRLRLIALDQKIEAWRDTEAKAVVTRVAPIPDPLLKVETVIHVPPPLPELPTFQRVEEGIWTKAESSPVQSVEPASPIAEVAKTLGFEKENVPPSRVSTSIPSPQKSSLEFKLGTVWLVRIGIVILLTGLVLLGNYAYHRIIPHIGPWGKLTALTLAGAILAGLGRRLEKQSENLRNYGRVLLAGGIAVFYYTTYAASFVARLRVIESPLLGGVFLLAVGAVVVWLAERRQSQTVALTAILLSYYTSAINPLGSFTLYSNLLLTGAAVFFLLRHRWTTLSFFSLVGTYGSFAFWRYYRAGHLFTGDVSAHDFWTGALFLAGYWILFTVAVFLSRAENFSAEKRTPFLTLNNGAFFGLIALSLHRWQPDFVGRFYLGFAVVLLGLSWIAKRRQSEDLLLDGAYLVQGLGLLTLGLVTELSGYQLATALAIQSTLLLLGLNRRHGWIYEMGAACTSFGALGIVLIQEPPGRSGWIVKCTLVGLFVLNSSISRHLKKPAPGPGLSGRSLGYGLLAFPLIASVLEKMAPAYPTQITFCMVAFVLLGLGILIHLPELGLVGQLFIVISSVRYCVSGITAVSGHPLLLLIAICLSPILMIYWWQRQKNESARLLGETLFSGLALAALARCLYDSHLDDSLVVATALVAVFTLTYGVFTRAFILALGGQLFAFATAWIYFRQTLFDAVPWSWPTVGLAILVGHQILLYRFMGKLPAVWRDFPRLFPQIFQALLFAMIGAWGWAYIELPGRMLFYVLFAAGLLALAHFQKERHSGRTVALMVYAGLSILWALLFYGFQSLWNHSMSDLSHRLNILSFFLLAAMHFLTKKSFRDPVYFPKAAQIGWLMSVVGGFWVETNHAISGSEFPKTVAWALLATVFLGVGLAIRERGYRLGGLLLLALSIIRIATVDVWKLDRLYQILSFLVLGILLLGIGYIYNKFADKLREWL